MSRPAALVRFAVCSLFALVALGVLSIAADPIANTKVDPQAKKVIDAWGKYFAGLRGFKFASDVAIQFEQQGQKQSRSFNLKLSAERPNKLAYSAEASAQSGATVVCDGSELAMSVKGFPRYGVEKAPETWTEMLQNQLILGSLSIGNGAVVTVALLADDPAKTLLEKTTEVKYGGTVDLDGAKCHLIQALGEELDWQLWILAGDKPLVRQFVPDLAKTLAKMARGKAQLGSVKITNTVTFKDWETNPKFPPDTFVFHAPEGVEKVDSLMAIISAGRETERGPHPLVGEAAPEVKLDLLDGDSFDLAEQKGKNVVILDFWATWCGPCRQAMPVIEKVADKYKDKGVMLVAVNLEEGAEDIQKFLEDSELKVSIALDKDGAVGRAYGAEAIPQTVLVGKDGSVQVVVVGTSPNLEAQLTKNLESLLAGKNLAAETLKAAKEKKDAAAAAKADDEDEKAAEKPAANGDKAGKNKAGKK